MIRLPRARKLAAKRKAGTFEAVFERFVELHVKQNTKEGRFARDRAATMGRRPREGKATAAKGPKSKPGRVAAERIIADNALPVWRGRLIETITRAEVHELLDDVITAPWRGPSRASSAKHSWPKCSTGPPTGATSPPARRRYAAARVGLRRPRARAVDGGARRVWDAAGEAALPIR